MIPSMSSVSLVIPAFNECDSIRQTVLEAKVVLDQAFDPAKVEIIVVDDGSTDKTGEAAGQAGAIVVRHPHNIGYGKALKSGIERAQYNTIVISDADGTYPLKSIPDLVAEFDRGFDMVVGVRTGMHYRGGAIKWQMRLLLRFLVEWAAQRSIPDINSGLRVFDRNVAMQYFSHLCNTFSFTTSLTLAYMMTDRFVSYIPIEYHERVGRSKVSLWKDSFRTLSYIIQAILYYSPMRIFSVMSILCLIISAISVVLGLIFHILTAFIMGVGAIIAAMIIFSLGLVADLLKQILAK
jgi:glycosyltransferase involved in cell wall biosynthesis